MPDPFLFVKLKAKVGLISQCPIGDAIFMEFVVLICGIFVMPMLPDPMSFIG